ncbi:MAG: signal recognition particle-docking protein FtsY [Spirochaetes bacterium]|nr:signal recognition particle-docking protein FtsY [Spirochaetota bacterium]
MAINFLFFSIAAFITIVIIVLIIFFILIKNKRKNKKNDYYSKSKDYHESLGKMIRNLFAGNIIEKEKINDLEDVMLKADIGPRITNELIEELKKNNPKNVEEAINFLKSEIEKNLIDSDLSIDKNSLNVFLLLGANGVGKTTSIAKIANYYLKKGLKVLLAAGDTYRAAAIEQLTKWANRLDIPIIKQKQHVDPSGVVFDAIDSANAKNVNLLLIDTAGRLHNKENLIEELKKIKKVILKKERIINKNLLVIDATTGQNAYSQAEAFNQAIGIDGIIVAKLDSMSKAGIIINIQKNLKLPIYFIGTGEKLDDLQIFNKKSYIENIFA